ncbi:substrate-binding periplasmic protein [Spartinivicinus poritis]|uniref:Transporter substrate-binding domain-containing protein n=1 Tax=Spartinivicinus poritis TaxID=2994640 RepID=A0ABT5UJ60_9GAMM|nr:transporter substrate-binding domain-containing protein [Spartinivicinus sp. A2-2]MDE1465991.1 transporter substrate-binding domain-containing protein [Spartinivicinus sp. A2-2]
MKAGLLLLLLSFTTYAKDTLSIGIPKSKPPYSFQDKGIIIDILKKVFDEQKFELKFIPLQNEEIDYSLRSSKIDVSTITHVKYKNLYYSSNYLPFDDVAITLEEKKLNIRTIHDLDGLSLVSWEGAPKLLGPEYQKLAKKNRNRWLEVPLQSHQNKMFWTKRTDVLICDLAIFLWMKNKLALKGIDTTKKYKIHRIFGGPIYQRAGFKSKNLRDYFDNRIEAIKSNGEYQSVFDYYKDPT